MASISRRHSSPSSTGVLPVLTTCLGPRTAEAGLLGATWPVISQSNSIRIAASCCFTPGAPEHQGRSQRDLGSIGAGLAYVVDCGGCDRIHVEGFGGSAFGNEHRSLLPA